MSTGDKEKVDTNKGRKTIYTIGILIDIGKEHIEHVTSKRKWNAYAKEHNLPSAQTIENYFETWNSFKQELNIDTSIVISKPTISKKEIEQVLKEHGHNIETRSQWDEYAKENNLPSYKTLKKHFTWEEVLSFANKQARLTNDYLLEIAFKHKDVFFPSSQRKWNEYAQKLKLPSYNAYVRAFGSWKKSKVELILWIEKKTQK